MLCASLPPACTPLHSLLFWLTACRCVTEVVPTVADPAQLCQSWEVPDSCSQDFGAKDQKAPPHPRSAHSLRSGMRFSLICLLFSNCGTGFSSPGAPKVNHVSPHKVKNNLGKSWVWPKQSVAPPPSPQPSPCLHSPKAVPAAQPSASSLSLGPF